MKKTILILTLCHMVYALSAQPLGFNWAKSFGGVSGNELSTGMVHDKQGNIFTTGIFDGTSDFDPGTSGYTITSLGNTDGFIQKLTNEGGFLWAYSIGANMEDAIRNIAIDSMGNIYVIGFFQDSVDFDHGLSTYQVVAASYKNAFILKLDNNGDFLWVKTLGDVSGQVDFTHVQVSETGNICIAGYINGNADMDPGAAVVTMSAPFGYDPFVLSLDNNGNFRWVKSIENGGYDIPHSMAIDKLGNVYTVGTFSGTADFDPDFANYDMTSGTFSDAFIQKLDSTGAFVWAKQIGKNGYDGIHDIKVDSLNNIYITGYFSDTVDFDLNGGVHLLIAQNNYDMYIAKYDANANFSWAKSIGAVNEEIGKALCIDDALSVYITGTYQDTVDFDPGIGVTTLFGNGTANVFILKLNALGIFEWVKQMGGTDMDEVEAILVDKNGSVYTYGNYRLTVDFDPESAVFDLVSNGGNDFFLQKLSTATILQLNNTKHNHNNVVVYPNPTTAYVNLTWQNSEENATINVWDTKGKHIRSEEQVSGTDYTICLPNESGMYIIQCVFNAYTQTVRIVKE